MRVVHARNNGILQVQQRVRKRVGQDHGLAHQLLAQRLGARGDVNGVKHHARQARHAGGDRAQGARRRPLRHLHASHNGVKRKDGGDQVAQLLHTVHRVHGVVHERRRWCERPAPHQRPYAALVRCRVVSQRPRVAAGGSERHEVGAAQEAGHLDQRAVRRVQQVRRRLAGAHAGRHAHPRQVAAVGGGGASVAAAAVTMVAAGAVTAAQCAKRLTRARRRSARCHSCRAAAT